MTLSKDLEVRIKKCYELYKHPPKKRVEVPNIVLDDQKDTAGHDCYKQEGYSVMFLEDSKRMDKKSEEIEEIFASLEDEQDRDVIANLFEWGKTYRESMETVRANILFKEGRFVPPKLLKKVYKSALDRKVINAVGEELNYSRIRTNMAYFFKRLYRGLEGQLSDGGSFRRALSLGFTSFLYLSCAAGASIVIYEILRRDGIVPDINLFEAIFLSK